MKKNARGRWSQYQILSINEIVKPYLLKTVLYNKHSFFQNSHRHLSFRPCYGQHEIKISEVIGVEEQYKVQDGNTTTLFCGKTEVFHYLNQVCKPNHFYILQDTDFLYSINGQMTELFVTVQRDLHSLWHVTDIFDKNGLPNHKIMKVTRRKIYEVAIETASCLVEDEPECPTVVLDMGLINEQLWINDIELHFSKSKWSQYQILSSIKNLSSYLPKTQLATPNTFYRFIKKYKQVMLKPCAGQWGIGVVQVSMLKGDVFEVHNESTIMIINGKQELINFLQTHYLSKESYIVQKRVKLATIGDSVFDARVMVQREDSDSEWEITTKVAKIAAKNFIITNVAKSILLLEEALEKSTIKKRVKKSLKKIDKACMIGALCIGNYYLDVTRIGFDVGIGKGGNIWILEANLVPDVNLFKRLEDKSIYEKIIKKKKR
ncbi:MAG TPA: YheC/YheD family protein [Neobacillus sp.]